MNAEQVSPYTCPTHRVYAARASTASSAANSGKPSTADVPRIASSRSCRHGPAEDGALGRLSASTHRRAVRYVRLMNFASQNGVLQSRVASIGRGQHYSERTDVCLGLERLVLDMRHCDMPTCCASRARYGLKHKRRQGLKKGSNYADRRSEPGAPHL